ncbi:probable BOI-related E3 ubiquitin-protein ligase 2 [Dioscorea cayenensis subsp. rotundata]|uniref:Probable BOI-related E3 ubiquitin-protein ligase 2 n=1 Tax=Dioscorea cayennensis subsp. rotundata TaxID=55577 RepID=A0AB40D1R4_DIOCR|nr:probable BOI-related E3 ubiquitin-protein ligase 2 [Dioscorea cayenensis subsp. rotundata]
MAVPAPRALALEEHHHLHHHQSTNLFGACYESSYPISHQPLNAFSGPESELTCNASGSRKRSRMPDGAVANSLFSGMKSAALATGLQLSGDQTRMIASAATSTSGRPSAVSPVAKDIVSFLYNQNLEIDALIRLQNERLRSGVEEIRKRHCRAMLSALEDRVAKRMMEKDAELEMARRRNADLEEKLRQLASENQIWFNVARNNEAVVSGLRSTLEQALLQNAAVGVPPVEGVGDSDGGAFAVDDAQSCCFEARIAGGDEEADAERKNKALKRRMECKVCGEREACVLVLPCRHFCLCRDCESFVDTCPVCQSAKNGNLHVFLS